MSNLAEQEEFQKALDRCELFCEECGDCLKCYGEDRCSKSNNGKHSWPKEPCGA